MSKGKERARSGLTMRLKCKLIGKKSKMNGVVEDLLTIPPSDRTPWPRLFGWGGILLVNRPICFTVASESVVCCLLGPVFAWLNKKKVCIRMLRLDLPGHETERNSTEQIEGCVTGGYGAGGVTGYKRIQGTGFNGVWWLAVAIPEEESSLLYEYAWRLVMEVCVSQLAFLNQTEKS